MEGRGKVVPHLYFAFWPFRDSEGIIFAVIHSLPEPAFLSTSLMGVL